MEAFLRKRGVREDTLKSLREQKIDEDAVRGMTDYELSDYLPKTGDRFALKDFISQRYPKPKSRKPSLMDRLRDRLRSNRAQSSDTNTDESESTLKKIPKLTAKKEKHKVHLGWYHFDEKRKIYLHVRAKSGGGKRTVILSKSMNKQSIIKECLDLFFPDGRSQYGDLKDMDVELTDFQLKTLDEEETTLEDIIDRAKLQFVHFYLRTRLTKQSSFDIEEKQTEEDDKPKSSTCDTSTILHRGRKQTTESTDNAESITEVAQLDSNNNTSTSSGKTDQQLSETTDKTGDMTACTNDEVLAKQGLECVSNHDDDISPHDSLFLPVWEDSFGEVAFTHTEPISSTVREPKEFKIVVHRGQVLRELIRIVKENPDIDFKRDIISTSLILPNGEQEQAYDNGGVMRDMLTEFWDDFYEQCTTGMVFKVPCLRHDMEAADWKAVGRVIALGWILQKILPIRLAPNFLLSCLYGLSSSSLRDEFLQFIPQSESRVISSALENIDNVEMDELLEILSSHECKVKVTKDNIHAVIDQIAHLEMVQEPAFIRECLFEVLITYELLIDVEQEFKKICPTSKKLISSLECDDSESDSFKYLKRYIREIDNDGKMLRTLLRFLTASDLMLYDTEGNFFKIQVRIVDLEGIARRPVAHTCGRVLDLPRMYESYPVFKAEMNAVLNSNIWVMDFV